MALMDRFKKNSESVTKPDVNMLRDQGDRLRDTGRFAEAAEFYGQYLAENPDDFGIWVQRGNCLKDSGSYVAAKMAYDHAVKLNPADDDIYVQIGHLMKKENKNKDAIFYYKESLKINENNANAMSELRAFGLKTKAVQSPLKIDSLLNAVANFIDIGDLISFLTVHSRVTGIQRVQSCIISEIIALHHEKGSFGAGNTIFCYCDQETQIF